MINGLSFDIEDWFQVENLRSACPRDKWETFPLRVSANTEKILALLDEKNQKATFFVLGWIAARAPELVRKIAKAGHEIASHGYNHEIVYRMTPKEFRDDLIASRKILEDLSGQHIIGYRAPNFSITQDSLWALDILKEEGFLYDSSIFPISFHDRYGFKGLKESKKFSFGNGLQELPITVYRLAGINIPIGGGGYFRMLPYTLFRQALHNINKQSKPFVFYLHPWEIDHQQPRVRIPFVYALRHYINLRTTYPKLHALLSGFQFQPLRGLL